MSLRALSVRQPYAENILRGYKTIEVRGRVTHLRERVYIYAGLQPGEADPIDLKRLGGEEGIMALARGVLVGTVELLDCRPVRRADSEAAGFKITEVAGLYAWVLGNPQRLGRRRTPTAHPQPGFFWPFGPPAK